jgi:type I restriction enzyme S subunit
MDAFAGAIGVSESDGKSTPEYVVCQPLNSGINNYYYAALLRWMAKQNYIFVICPSVRERAPRFRFSTLKDVKLPIPPDEEQEAIAKFILDVPARINPILDKLRQQVDAIYEYRQALITAAVIGKLDLTQEKAISEDTSPNKQLDLK